MFQHILQTMLMALLVEPLTKTDDKIDYVNGNTNRAANAAWR